MGCDIHLYMEYKNPTNTWSKRWSNFGKRIYVGRNYYMFGLMAGVRGSQNPIAAPRGIPDDIDFYTAEDFYYSIEDTNGYNDDGQRTITLENAQRWGTKIELDDKGVPYRIANPDWHTPSWLTFDELTSALLLADLAYERNMYDNSDPRIKELHQTEAPTFLLEYKALSASMETFENAGYNTRIVFWFDN